MACPHCGCKETYEFNDEDYGHQGGDWERCAACSVVFRIEEHAVEDDDAAEPAPPLLERCAHLRYTLTAESGYEQTGEHYNISPETFGAMIALLHGTAEHAAPAAAESAPAGWRQGVEAVAQMLAKKAADFADEYGHDDMGGLSFGRGTVADARLVWHSGLLELEDEARAMLAAAPQALAPAPAPAHREFYAVIATGARQGVMFDHPADARWTHTGEGAGSDGFGVPTIGEGFRESYGDAALELVKVRVVEGGAA